MPLYPETAGVILRSNPRSLRHLRSEAECAFLGMAASATATLSCRLGERRSRWTIVSMYHPRTVFWVDQDSSYFPSFFREMGSLQILVGAENPVDLVEEVTEKLAPLPGDSMEN